MNFSLCRSLQLAIIFYTFGWPVEAKDSLFTDTLLRKDQVQTVLDHTPVKETSCENSVVRLSKFDNRLSAHNCFSSQVRSRQLHATTRPSRVSAKNYLEISRSWSIRRSSDTSKCVPWYFRPNCQLTVAPSQVDLYRECPFWSEHGSCTNPSCAITTVDEVSELLDNSSLPRLNGWH